MDSSLRWNVGTGEPSIGLVWVSPFTGPVKPVVPCSNSWGASLSSRAKQPSTPFSLTHSHQSQSAWTPGAWGGGAASDSSRCSEVPQCVSCHPLFLTQQAALTFSLHLPFFLGKYTGTGQAPGSAIRGERVCQGQAVGATGSPSSGACCTVLSKHFTDVLPPVLYPSYPGWELVHGLHSLKGKPLNPVSGPRGRGPFPSVASSGK